MTRLYLLEPEIPDPAAPGPWEPFGGVRPVCELRVGAWLVRERWQASLDLRETAGIVGDHVEGFVDVESPPVVPARAIEGPAMVAASCAVPPREALRLGPECPRLVLEDRTAAWWIPPGDRWPGARDSGPARAIGGMWLQGCHDVLGALERFLASDCLEFTAEAGDPLPGGCIVIGDPAHVVCLGARVEPGVVFDVREGAVVLAEGVEVRSGTRLHGPVYAGPGTRMLGGQIRHSSFGPECRVHGEVADSVFVGYANKSHDGFVGHSVLGHWVNLGAGTITSNLKNTYGPVRLSHPSEGAPIDTGRTFLGSLIGDHAKTAIGTLLGTGTVVGAGANVFGGGPVPRYVRAFAWGCDTGTQQMDVEGFVRIAGRVMPRRKVALTPEREAALRRLHARKVR
jgi:hypothetical protein